VPGGPKAGDRETNRAADVKQDPVGHPRVDPMAGPKVEVQADRADRADLQPSH